MKRFLPFLLCLVLMVLAAAPGYAQLPGLSAPSTGKAVEASPLTKAVYEIKVHGVIGPPAAQFISESIKNAGSAGCAALLILLDTPGGLDTSMRDIVKAIMEAPLPVIVYVLPVGGQGRIGRDDHPYRCAGGRHGARHQRGRGPSGEHRRHQQREDGQGDDGEGRSGCAGLCEEPGREAGAERQTGRQGR